MSIPVSARTLRALRKAIGWSIDHLARKSGVSRSTILRIEKADGCYQANSEQAEGLARAFGVNVESLTSDGVNQIIVAEGDFVPIRHEFFTVSYIEGDIRLTHVGTNLKDPQPDHVMATMVGTAPGTLIIRSADD